MKVLERVYLLFYSPPTMHDIDIAYELLSLPGTSRRSESSRWAPRLSVPEDGTHSLFIFSESMCLQEGLDGQGLYGYILSCAAGEVK